MTGMKTKPLALDKKAKKSPKVKKNKKAKPMDEATKTFHGFPDLPPELQRKIWRESLGPAPEATLFFYQPELWIHQITRVPCKDLPDAEHYLATSILSDQRLDRVKLDLPQYNVNQQARSMVIEWAQKHKVDIHTCSVPGTLFTHKFRHSKDVLWIHPMFDVMEDANDPPIDYDRVFEAEMHSCFSRIALPMECFQDLSVETVVSILCMLKEIKEVIFLVGSVPNHDCTKDHHTIQQRWNFDRLPESETSDMDCFKEAFFRSFMEEFWYQTDCLNKNESDYEFPEFSFGQAFKATAKKSLIRLGGES